LQGASPLPLRRQSNSLSGRRVGDAPAPGQDLQYLRVTEERSSNGFLQNDQWTPQCRPAGFSGTATIGQPAIDCPSGIQILLVVFKNLSEVLVGNDRIVGLAGLDVPGDGPVAAAGESAFEAHVFLHLLQAVAREWQGRGVLCNGQKVYQRGDHA